MVRESVEGLFLVLSDPGTMLEGEISCGDDVGACGCDEILIGEDSEGIHGLSEFIEEGVCGGVSRDWSRCDGEGDAFNEELDVALLQ